MVTVEVGIDYDRVRDPTSLSSLFSNVSENKYRLNITNLVSFRVPGLTGRVIDVFSPSLFCLGYFVIEYPIRTKTKTLPFGLELLFTKNRQGSLVVVFFVKISVSKKKREGFSSHVVFVEKMFLSCRTHNTG